MNILQKPKGGTFERFPDKFEEIFREAWTNNANVISILYSGTPALKTDFTWTGKRTRKGAVDDGVNSLKWFYINQFTDGYNQDCLDFLTSKISGTQLTESRQGIKNMVNSFLLLLTVVRYFNLSLEFSFISQTISSKRKWACMIKRQKLNKQLS